MSLIAANVGQIQFDDVWRSMLGVIFIAGMLCVFTHFLIRDWKRAGLVSSLFLLLFFSYGHVFHLIEGKVIGDILIGRADILFAVWEIVFILGSWWIIRKAKHNWVLGLTQFLNLTSTFAILLSGFQILTKSAQFASVTDPNFKTTYEETPTPQTIPNDLPDIYYIIVDAYGRADILEELYSYDNSKFMDFLLSRGFYIAESSLANYSQTLLSLSSSLNFSYIDDLTEVLTNRPTSRLHLVNLIKHSKLRHILEEAGYQIVTLASGYSGTEIEDADWYLNNRNSLNDFELALLKNSAATVIPKVYLPNYRSNLLSSLTTLAHMPDTGSPRFVFAHIMLPHVPFVFGPDGEDISPSSFSEGNFFKGTIDEYIEGYRGQLIFLNKQLIYSIDGILSNSNPKPIIILQSDHGPGAYMNWESTSEKDSVESNCFKERMSILNAYYMPDITTNELYTSITPVNTFRIILNTYFQARLPLLEDKNYFSSWNTPFQLVDITNQVDTCDY